MVDPKKVLASVTNNLKLISVEPYMFFIMFGYAVRLVTLQNLLMDRACRNLHLLSDEICSDLDSHKYYQDAAIETGNNLYTGIMLIACLPAIIAAIFVGPWSDKYSRKYPLMIASCGMTLEAIASSIVASQPNLSPVWFIVAAIFEGFSGGFIMTVSASFSYIADVTDEKSRPTRYAVLEFANILAIILGTLLGSEIFKAGGHVPVMIVAPCSFGIAFLYSAIFVKDTKQRVPGVTCAIMSRDLVTTENIRESYKTCAKKRPGNIRLQIWLLVWIAFSNKFLDMGTLAIAYPFARTMYNWDISDFSTAITAFYVVNAFATVVIIPILSKHMQLHEAALGLVGMLSLTAKMIVISVAYQEPFFYYGFMSGSLNNATGIAFRSRLSKLVKKEELGRAFSLLGTCESVTPLLGTLIFVQIFNASTSFFPGLPYACAAVFLIPSIVIFSWMLKLPTISLGDYAQDEAPDVKPMETYSSNYVHLEEDKF